MARTGTRVRENQAIAGDPIEASEFGVLAGNQSVVRRAEKPALIEAQLQKLEEDGFLLFRVCAQEAL